MSPRRLATMASPARRTEETTGLAPFGSAISRGSAGSHTETGTPSTLSPDQGRQHPVGLRGVEDLVHPLSQADQPDAAGRVRVVRPLREGRRVDPVTPVAQRDGDLLRARA